MVPGYYMSKRGISLPKLEEKTAESSAEMYTTVRREGSKVSPKSKSKNPNRSDLSIVDLKQISRNGILIEDLDNFSHMLD
jgi:hypothetical protein